MKAASQVHNPEGQGSFINEILRRRELYTLGLKNVQQFEPRSERAEIAWEAGRFVDRDGQVWRELGMNELVYSEGFLQAGL